jgi:serine/threonine protein kinase
MGKRARKWGTWTAAASHISEGGQARVYLVVDQSCHRKGEFVLKVLKNPKRKGRFQREVALLRTLHHSEHIVPVVDYGGDDAKNFWYVMPRASGTLHSAVENGEVSFDFALRFFDHICLGVCELHSVGIIHRDLKPDNILLFGDTAKVSDFGLAFDPDEPRLTASSEAVGSRLFMAPELEDGRLKDVSTRTDVYSVGKLLYFLLTRGVTFAREKHLSREYNIERRASDPRAKLFESLLSKSIAASPLSRFKDAKEMHDAYARALEEYHAHPLTQVLARSTSLDLAACACESELLGLPQSQLSTLIEHVASSNTLVPTKTLLNVIEARLRESKVLRSACKFLLAREEVLDAHTSTKLAGALVTASVGSASVMLAVGIEGERKLMEMAIRDEDLEVLNALMSKTNFNLRSFPIVAERIGKQITRLSREARRNFLVSTYSVPWAGKEEVLIAYLGESDDLLEIEAVIAGLCNCGTSAACARVDQFADETRADEILGALLRGIVAGGQESNLKLIKSPHVQRLASLYDSLSPT